MSGLSASKRRSLMSGKANEVDRMMTGATGGAIRWLPCHAQGRRGARLVDCSAKLAEIRFEPGGVVAFEVLAPIRDEGGVIVLEKPAKRGYQRSVIRPAGRSATFRCAECGKDTRVDLAELRKTGPTLSV